MNKDQSISFWAKKWIAFFVCFSPCLKSLATDSNQIVDRMAEQRSSYLKALALIKQGYSILLTLEKDLFIDSSDFFKALDYFRLKKYDSASSVFVSLIKKGERKLESMFLLAECFFFKKNFDKAAAIYNDIISTKFNLYDDNSILILKNTYLKLIDCFILLGKKKDACIVMSSYLKFFPNERNNDSIKLFCAQNNYGIYLQDDDINDNSEIVIESTKIKKKKKKSVQN